MNWVGELNDWSHVGLRTLRYPALITISKPVSVRAPEAGPNERERYIFDGIEDAYRHRLYKFAWSHCRRRIEEILSRQHAQNLDEIAEYLRQTDAEPSSTFELPLIQAVPAAFVIGATQWMLRVLADALRDSEDHIAPLVASINSAEASTIKTAIRSIVSRLIAAGGPSRSSARQLRRKPSLLSSDDMTLLQTWYDSTFRKEPKRPIIAIILCNVEGFSPRVIAGIVHTLSLYRRHLPIALVLGVSTSIESVQRRVSKAFLPDIRPRVFSVDTGIESFNAVIEGVFLTWNKSPLDISPDVFTCLRSSYEDINLSLDGLISKIQYIYLSHFLLSPFALYALHNQEDAPPLPKELHLSLSRLILCPSLADTNLLHNHQACLSRSYDWLGALDASLSNRRAHQKARIRAWELFSLLEMAWPQGRIVKVEQLQQYYDNELVGEIVRLCRNLKLTTISILRSFLINVENRATPDWPVEYAPWCHEIEDLVKEQTLGWELQNGNQLGAQAMSRADRDFTRIAAGTADLTERLVIQGLASHASVPLQEIWTFDDETTLRQTFHPNMQGSIARNAGEAYDRLQEAGKLVNLADWYDTLLQRGGTPAKFVREVSSLAYVGIVAPTKRRTEHVARTAW